MLDEATPSVGDRLLNRLGGAAGHLPAERGEGEAGQPRDDGGEREPDDGERLEGEGDADQTDSQEEGGDEPTPAGHSTRSPAKPSSAGRRVSDAMAVTATTTAQAMAIPVMNARFISSMPSSEMTTVDAREGDSPSGGVDGDDGGLLDRGPDVQVLPIPGDDEQGVVDARHRDRA